MKFVILVGAELILWVLLIAAIIRYGRHAGQSNTNYSRAGSMWRGR